MLREETGEGIVDT